MTKISIIIAVKNAKDPLKRTLDSIRAQTIPLEIIVIDSLSSDGTLNVITQNQDIISAYRSEPDRGISDAFNKGLKLATGDYINYQGAGDLLFAPDCIERLFSNVVDTDILICGKVMRVQEDGTPLWVAPKQIKAFKPSTLLFKMSLPHQGLFTHRSFFEKFGVFDLEMKFAMDYELLLRAYHQFPKTVVKDIIVSKWQAGGVGSNRILEVFDEYHRIKMQHHIAAPSLLKLIDQLNRLKYRIKTKWLRLAY